MSLEILDVVDAGNNVVGKATRTEVHLRGLMHRSVHIFVFNRKKELFIQKRSASVSSFPLYHDSSAAGHVGSGESYEACARRELSEELGIADIKLDLRVILPAQADGGNEFVALFTCRYDGEITLQKSEVESGRFEALDWVKSNLGRQKFTPNFKRCFSWYTENEDH